MPVLTLLDVLGIQKYVFASNRLRDAVAGSQVIEQVTSNQPGGWLEHEPVLLAGGGNALLRFESKDGTEAIENARAFAGRYSRLLLEKARGLEVALVHREYEAGQLAQAILGIQKDIAQVKLSRRPSVPLLGLSVTERCAETGLPAVGLSLKPRGSGHQPVSGLIADRETLSKDKPDSFAEFELPNMSFPLELDDLGRTVGEKSAVAVVHIDCNGLGQQFKQLIEVYKDEADAEVEQAYIKQSSAIAEKMKMALRTGLEVIAAVAPTGKVEGYKRFDFKHDGNSKLFFPLRPLVLGGDDLTFVCDGRIALEVTAVILRIFATDVGSFNKVEACAGIAIVKSHFPFSKAYDLAEELCRRAKRTSRQVGEGCALDWYIGLSGLEQRLTLSHVNRPYLLTGRGSNWDEMEKLLDYLNSSDWQDRSGKLKALGEIVAIANRPSEVLVETLSLWGIGWPQEHEWALNNPEALLDALEILDLYCGLKHILVGARGSHE